MSLVSERSLRCSLIETLVFLMSLNTHYEEKQPEPQLMCYPTLRDYDSNSVERNL